jgi:PRTRC genetic system protein A
MTPRVIETPEEFNALCAMREAEGVIVTPSVIRVATVRPNGIYLRTTEGDSDEESLSFVSKLPPVPWNLFKKILDYFAEDLSKEAAVRVCYDEHKKEYFFVKAGGSVGGAFIKYDYSDSVEEILRDGVICAMEVHSHNRMDAFWSCVDDADELMAPGAVYGVVGRLDKTPSFKFRACYRGLSADLDPESLIEEPGEAAREWAATNSPDDDKNAGSLDRKLFFCGAFDVLEGKIVETHTYEECQMRDFNSVWCFGDNEEKFDDGSWLFFWIDPSETIPDSVNVFFQNDYLDEGAAVWPFLKVIYEGAALMISKEIDQLVNGYFVVSPHEWCGEVC